MSDQWSFDLCLGTQLGQTQPIVTFADESADFQHLTKIVNGQRADWRHKSIGYLARVERVNDRVGGLVGHMGKGGVEHGPVGVAKQDAV